MIVFLKANEEFEFFKLYNLKNSNEFCVYFLLKIKSIFLNIIN